MAAYELRTFCIVTESGDETCLVAKNHAQAIALFSTYYSNDPIQDVYEVTVE